MKTVLLDVDGVISDCASVAHRAAEGILGRPLPGPDSWTNYEFEVSMNMTDGEASLFRKAIRSDDNIGWKIDLYPGAEDFVNTLTHSHDVCFVTAPWRGLRHWVTARENLLNKYFPGVPVIFAHSYDKFRIKGDVLVEDCQETLVANMGRAVRMVRPWNQRLLGVPDVRNYSELLRVLGSPYSELRVMA